MLLGGPGEAATSAAQWYGDDPTRPTATFLLVDARGTGKSNGLHCPIPKDGPLQGFMPTMNLPVLKACRPELEKRADLRYYLTPYAMDDLDDLRAALGYDKINLDAGSTARVPRWPIFASTASTFAPRRCGAAPLLRSRCRCISRRTPSTRYATFSATATPSRHARRLFPTLEADYRRTVERIEKGPVRVTVKDPRNEQADAR